jgi:hypothetical protein
MSLLASTPKTYPASLLLNFDAFPFVDSSIYNSTISNIEDSGDLGVTTGSAKFGAYSGNFGGSNRLLITVGNEFNFGTGDFTAECWFNPSSVNDEAVLFSMGDPTDGYGIHVGLLQSSYNNNQGPTIRYLIGNGSWAFEGYGDYLDSYNNVSLNTWHHVAMTRSSGILRLYLNGNLIDEIADSTNVTNYNGNIQIGGRYNLGQYFRGKIDGLRVTKGVALYTSTAFTLPNTPPSKNAIIAPKLNNHLVMTSTKSSGDITGYITTTTGFYTVNWWDGTKTTYLSGDSFSKSAVGGSQTITIYPSLSDGTLSGSFANADVSNNNLTSVRPFFSSFTHSPGGIGPPSFPWIRTRTSPYYYSYYSQSRNRYYGYTGYAPGQFIAGTNYNLNIGYNNLDSSALNQFYTDLLYGSAIINVSDNTGGDSDDPSIATAKGYTVYGSFSPIVSALFNFDSNFSDSGGNNVALTTYGTAAINTTIKKYGAGSAFFDSSGDYAESASSTFFGFGKDDFTIEFWLYKLSDGSYFHGIVCIGTYTNGILFRHQPGGDSFYLAGTYYNWNATTNCPNDQWTHIAIVRKNGYFSVYANGSKVLSGYNDADLGSTQKLTIGASSHNTAEGLNGYIDGLKIVKGKALYTGSFTLPSSAPTTSTSSVTPLTNTQLLLNFGGSNGSTTFTDSSSYARTVTRTNTVISTAQSKWPGGSSAYFSNSGSDALAVVDSMVLAYEDYTIEFFFYLINLDGMSDNPRLFSIENSTATWGILLYNTTPARLASYNHYGTSEAVEMYDYTNSANRQQISLATWHHFAMTKQNNTYKIFFNGYQIGSKTAENYTPTGNVVITIGGSRLNYQYNKLNAYIDDFRIIKGKALYTSNFTPPTSQLTTYP